jgi:hypothetical protein
VEIVRRHPVVDEPRLYRITAVTVAIDAATAGRNAAEVLRALCEGLAINGERELFLLKLNGLPKRVVAELLGLQHDNIRQRSSRLCRQRSSAESQ